MMRKVLLMIVAVVSCNAVFGQLSGVKSIPGDYPSIQSAVTDLNTQGVGSGGVTFNVAAGHTESVTAPILITATGTASNPIVFQKSGSGANPSISRSDTGSIITSAHGGQGDGVVIIHGSDYLSFISINIITVHKGIEYGYFLRKASVTDGCKNISILSCNITMTKGTSNYVAGIYSSNLDAASAANSATGITVTSEGGRNENVTINGNTVQDCHTGILLRGFSHSSSPYNFYDQNFIVGASGNGNIISNYGNTATAYGIYSIYQNNTNFSYNTISSDPNHTSTLYGISVSTATNANVTLNNNEVTIQTNTASSSSYGISNAAGSSGTTNTVNIQNNIVSGLVSPLVTSASFYGIQNTGSAFLVNINNNQITGNTLGTGATAATGSFYGISSSGSNSTSGSITNINDNEISGNARQQSAPGSGVFYGIYCSSSGLTLNVFNNEVSNNYMPTTTSTQGLLYVTAASVVKKIYNNQLYAHLNSGGNIYGIYNLTGTDVEIYKNNIYDLNGTYTSASYSTNGIYISSGTNVSVYNNYISDLKNINSTNQNAVNGIYISGGTNVRTYYNTIYLDASSSSAGNFGTNGIYCATTPIVDIKNNIVVNNSTPGPTGFAVALRYAGVITNYNGNYNDWYAGSPSAQNLIFYDGINSDQNIVAFQSRVNPDDNASFSSVPPFVNIATTPYDLHLQTTVATKCESGGIAISTPVNINGDYDGDARYPNAGYPDNPSYPATAPDVGADEFAGMPSFTCAAPTPGNILTSSNNICLGQSVILSLEFPPSGTGLSYDWQSSSDGITYTSIPGANHITYTVTPTDETYYQCVVTCQNGPSTGTSNPVQISFSSEITSTTPGSCCGTGTVQLAATGTGSSIDWFSSPSGGMPVGTGSPFTTPVITATTTFYAGTSNGLTSSNVGAPNTSISASLTSQSTTTTGINFDVLAGSVLINSVDIFPTVAIGSPFTITVKQGANVIATYTGNTTVSGSISAPVAQTVPLNFIMPSGTGYQMTASTNPGIIRNSGGDVFPYTLPGVISLTSSTLSGYYYNFYNWVVSTGCESALVPVVATVTTPPLLSLTSDQTICNNAITSIQVTSNIPDYDTYVWTPVTNLFTDAACTTPYLSGTSATTVYFQSNVPATTTYTCTATNNTSLCVENKTSAITVLPVASTITASPASLCISGSSSLTVDPASGYGAATFQWQNSPDGTTFTDISGATTLNYSTPVINTTTHYKLIIKDGTGNICLQPQVTINVNSPQLTGTTQGSRCGSGTVTLAATNNPISVIYWYNVATGGAPMASGSPFTTPVISTTTNYYAAAENHYNANITVGSGVSTSTGYQGPFYYSYGAEKSQYLIPASVLQAAGLVAGNITALAFNVTSNGATFNDFSLNIGHTSLSALTTTFVTGLSNVYTTAGITPTAGIFTITFDTPFNWDGSSNLVVETCWGNNNGGATPHAHVKYDTTSYIATAYQRQDNVTAAVFCPGTTTYGTYSSRPQLIFSGVTSCSTPRTMVTATVTPAPALTLTGNQTICNDAAGMIQVTSTLSDYDSYIWTPTAGLYTDAGCTTPYVGGTSATTVYIKTTIGGVHTLTCNASNSVSLCSEIATTNVTVLPGTVVVNATPDGLCYSGSSVLLLNPATGYGTGTLQWQDSPDGITYTDISGAVTNTYTTPVINTTTYYQAVIKDGTGNTCLTPKDTLVVNAPQITGTTPATRCGVGTVNLAATGIGGTLNWYTNAVGGAPIGTGSPFTTPVIITTSDYYVGSETNVSGNISVGSGATTSATYSNPFYSLYSNIHTQHLITAGELLASGLRAGNITSVALDVTSAGTLPMIDLSVKIGPTTASSMSAFIDNSGFTVVYTNASLLPSVGLNVLTFSTPFYWDGTSNIVLEFCHGNGSSTATMSRTVKADVTSYVSSIKVHRTSSSTSSVICADIISNLLTYSLRPTFTFAGQSLCSSPRTMVTATVNPAPSLNISATPPVICLNDNSNLQVSSANDPNYSYNWMPGNLSGATQLVSPTATAAYTVTATDASGGPNDGCVNTASVSVTVNPLPSSVSVTPPAANLCAGDIQMLTASGGIGTTSGTVGTGTASNTSSTPYRGYYGGTKVQLLYTAAELTALGLVSGSQITQVSFNISSFTSPYNFTDFYIAMKNTTSTATATALETGLTQVFSTPLFTLSGTAPFTVSHVLDTPFSWDGTSNLLVETCYNNNNAGGVSGNSASLVSTSTSPNYYAAYYSGDNIATVCSAPGTATRTYTRPNIGLLFTVPSPITWAPTASLYTNAGGTIPYTGTPATTVYAMPSTTTTYTATATNQFTCTSAGTAVITIAPISIGSVNTTQISCNGASDASITVSASGGSGTLQYSIDNGVNWQTSNVFNPLAAGTYNVVVKDALNCEQSYSGNPIVLSNPDVFAVSASVTSAILCFGGTATVTITATGGTTPYTYTFNGVTNATGVFTGIPAGTGYAWSADDANGCGPVTGTLNVSEPVLLTGGASVTSAILCNGGTATVTLTASGGTTPYSYTFNGVTNATGIFTGVPAGTTYSWSVTDANTCGPVTGTLDITQPDLFAANAAVTTAIACNGGTATVTITATGGTIPFSYTFNGVTNATGIFTGITAGIGYAWSADDANGCGPISGVLDVNQPDILALSASITSQILCNGGYGTVTLVGSGGISPYQYSVDNGIIWQASGVFNTLIAGSYNLRVKDANNCEADYLANPLALTQPDIINISNVSSLNPSCNGSNDGSITITSSGGTGTHNYSIDNGLNWQISSNFSNLIPGSYTVIVKDANNCEVNYSANPVIITDPTVLAITGVLPADPGCHGINEGTIIVNASGGTAALQYSIDNGGTWQFLNTFSLLAPGNYYIKVKDANNCITTYASNPIVITEPPLLSVAGIIIHDVSCFGGYDGSIVIDATGGTGAYEFSVDSGYTWVMNDTVSGLIAGSYNVMVRDSNLCQSVWASNPVMVAEPAELIITQVDSTDVTTVGGSDGTITVHASGGTGTIQYSIDGGTTWQNNGGLFTGLTVGDYIVWVKDSNDCITEWVHNPVHLSDPTGIGTATSNENYINLYPNPAKEEVIIEAKGLGQVASIEILSFDGKVVDVLRFIDNNANELYVKYNFAAFARGVYFIRINETGGVHLRKLILN